MSIPPSADLRFAPMSNGRNAETQKAETLKPGHAGGHSGPGAPGQLALI
jgi:hypothetical protein